MATASNRGNVSATRAGPAPTATTVQLSAYSTRTSGYRNLLCSPPIAGRITGPKISQNVNYTQRGTMEGPKAPSEAWRREAPECRGGGVWGRAA